VNNWWEAEEWGKSKPMNYIDRSGGKTVPVKCGPCRTQEKECVCKASVRVHVGNLPSNPDCRVGCDCAG